MKILLLEHPREIYPERCNDVANTPLSSCLLTGYTAAVLRRQGYAAEIVEGYLDGLSYEAIAESGCLRSGGSGRPPGVSVEGRSENLWFSSKTGGVPLCYIILSTGRVLAGGGGIGRILPKK
ncbi:MAG: hypothetical protein AB1556_12805 [Bacillota bacterium]